ncbi:MAG: hypothetical protein IJT87_03640 [Ruminiclostridium sp.]|nr:hypothetical protein [Ruminiclostridium sp.]
MPAYPPVRRVPSVNVSAPQAAGIVTVSRGQLTGAYNADKTAEVCAGRVGDD